MKKLRPLLKKVPTQTVGGRPKHRANTEAYRATPPSGVVGDRTSGTIGGKSGWVLLNEQNVDLAFLERHEHYVYGVWCLPADLAIGLSIDALSASGAGSDISLSDLVFVEPLIVIGSKTIRLRIEQSIDSAQSHVRIVSLAPGQSSPAVHFRSAYHRVGEQSMEALKEQALTWIPQFNKERSRGKQIRLNGITSAIRLGRGYGSLALTGSNKAFHSGLLIRDETVKNGSAWSDHQIIGACFTALISTGEDIEQEQGRCATFLPVRIDRAHLFCIPEAIELTVGWRLREQSADHSLLADIVVYQAGSQPVFAMEGVQLFRTDRSRFLQRVGAIKDGADNTDGTGHSQHCSSVRPVAPVMQKQTNHESRDKRETAAEVAVIGMSGLFPGAATTDEFWQNLCDAKNAITEVPSNRWREFSGWYNPNPGNQGTSSSKVGGFIDEIDHFDHDYFKISRADAELMDPHQRLMLQEAIRALDNAALISDHFDGSDCGVFIGATRGDYDRVLDSAGLYKEGKAFTGTSASLIASNIAYHLNLAGPTVVVDTACSSSLTAVHLACASIDRGECELALVGGVNLFLSPIAHIHTSQVGMQSAKGECRTFDVAADGTVFSEACAAIVLKRLDAARHDGDPILASISGSGINHDGKTNGITAPSSLTQARLMRQVLERSSLQSSQISYVEAHGTATPLGDPIEVKALAEVYGGSEGNPESCLVGSVKSNIGHCGYAAGIVGLIKCVLCLKHEKVPPSLHFTEPNKRIDFSSTRFEVSRCLQPWQDRQLSPRYCAVSSFGFGGSNAHVVLRSATGRSGEKTVSITADGATKAFYIPVSAESYAGISGAIFELGRYLQARIAENEGFVEHDLSVANIAYTLEHRRRSRCAFRALFKANSIVALADTLIAQAVGGLAEISTNVWLSESVLRDSGINMEIARESVDTYRERLTPDQLAWILQQPDACGLNEYPASVVALNLPGYCFEKISV
ncbi:MAG: beta-ketoacyl synthase N-terminal-like domain-containing protein, partial [Candidatus Thiodiazotropha sp.]